MGFEDLVYLWTNGVASRKTSRINIEEGAYLYKLVRSLTNPLIVEIGTRMGGTTKLLQEANAFGTVISIDLNADVKTELDKDRVSLLCCDSTEIKFDRPVDLLFIDGDHYLKGVKADWDNWHSLVKPGGHIIFHDCYLKSKKEYQTVIDLITELKENCTIGKEYIEQPSVASLCHLVRSKV